MISRLKHAAPSQPVLFRLVVLCFAICIATLMITLYEARQSEAKLRSAICNVYQTVSSDPAPPASAFGENLKKQTGMAAGQLQCTPNPFDGK